MAEPDYSIPQVDRIIRGIEIIRKYEGDPYPVTAEHDVLYCGPYETREKMTEEERELMDTYGWLEVDGSWGFFT
jgi:hypothetical protein